MTYHCEFGQRLVTSAIGLVKLLLGPVTLKIVEIYLIPLNFRALDPRTMGAQKLKGPRKFSKMMKKGGKN